jgi:hypothetical protein
LAFQIEALELAIRLYRFKTEVFHLCQESKEVGVSCDLKKDMFNIQLNAKDQKDRIEWITEVLNKP